ncbi:MAG: AAA family ATPase [Magnetococcales bacterium]|nr:AAA family ATPase [Magnetococcales bacterium]
MGLDDRYEIRDCLHESQKSRIFRAIEPGMAGRPVILKIINGHYPSKKELARFRLEYETTRSLDLSGVIKVYRFEREGNLPVIVMEDFGGSSLDRHLKAGPLELGHFLDLALKVGATLGDIHKRKVIHKDINPANIVWNRENGLIRIIDFGIATPLEHESTEPLPPDRLEGTLPYLSPEQTGRTNRSVDYRSDWYALGATFFELLAGHPPFTATDPLELVHCHVARNPPSLETLAIPGREAPAIPSMISRIILKLLAKDPEDRYQSAAGLMADLERCRGQWEQTGRIEPFALGTAEVRDRFAIPQHLYGREEEVSRLRLSFDAVCAGTTRLLLVAGYSGIGKSALVKELHGPVTKQQGLYVAGKFDQYQRDVPFSAIIKALGQLIRWILTEPEERIALWRQRILDVLHDNGQVITAVVPELEWLLGPQPTPPRLNPQEEENRFFHLVQNFLSVLAGSQHPLVLFLDDMQWADIASFRLIRHILRDEKVKHLLMIWAYRDNEITSGHPLPTELEALAKDGVALERLTLRPLDQTHLIRLVADTLNADPRKINPLAVVCHEKSGGNPFFLRQFLTILHQRQLIRFQETGWHWNIEDIQNLALTENVVDLIRGRLERFDLETRRILGLASCIGSVFDLDTLSAIAGTDFQRTMTALWPALEGEVIVAATRDYLLARYLEQGEIHFRFNHDRLQEAVHEAMDETLRQHAHLAVGRTLWADWSPPGTQDDAVFDIVTHLNQAIALIENQEERNDLARMNLLAGQRAASSAAFHSSFGFLKTGVTLLGPSGWNTNRDLVWNLHYEMVRTAAMMPDYEAMEFYSNHALAHAGHDIERGEILEIKVQSYQGQNRLRESLSLGLELLDSLGFSFPREPDARQLGQSLEEGMSLTSDRTMAQLIDLPEMTDPRLRLALRIVAFLVPVVVLTRPTLLPFMIVRTMKETFRSGLAPPSPVLCAGQAVLLCGFMDQYDLAYRMAKTAILLAGRPESRPHRAEAMQYANLLIPWKEHFRNSLPIFDEVFATALETGQNNAAGFSCEGWSCTAIFLGFPLEEVERKIADRIVILRRMGQYQSLEMMGNLHQMVLNLLGRSKQPHQIDGPACNGTAALLRQKELENGQVLFNLLFNQLYLYYFFRFHEEALATSLEAARYKDSMAGIALYGVYCFIDSLNCLACSGNAPSDHRQELLDKVAANQRLMDHWANHAPMNFRHKFHLVEAETYRVRNIPQAALGHYDRAIALAREHGFPSEEGLALELAGRFCHEQGWRVPAGHYLRDAIHAYHRWGAEAKVTDVKKSFPGYLFPAEPAISSAFTSILTKQSTIEDSTAVLDLGSIIRASQIIFRGSDMPGLLADLMRLALENGGAERGCLILREDGCATLEVEAWVEPERIELWNASPLGDGADKEPRVPLEIINLTLHTPESLLLDDALGDDRFSRTFYVQRRKPRSILCVPLVHSGQVLGVIYLENNLIQGAFPPQRSEMMRLLGTLAAISIASVRHTTRLVAARESLARSNLRIRELAAHQEDVRENEQRRIAGEIHDELGSALTRLGMDITWLIGHPPKGPDELARQLDGLKDLTGSIHTTVRRISHAMRPAVLDQFGLLPALEWLATGTGNRDDFKIHIREDSQEVLLDDARRTALFRIAQEAITNAIRHSAAQHLTIALNLAATAVVMTLEDDGHGIPPDRLADGGGFGLRGMKERARRFDGRVEIEAIPSGGTRVRATLPRLPSDLVEEQ